MADSQTTHITKLLTDWSHGDQAAGDQLIPLVEAELRRLAHHYMNRERAGHTLQTTALINEAYLRLAGQEMNWQNRAHFLGIAARLMRQILIDYARKRNYAKRGGDAVKVSVDDAASIAAGERAQELIALDEALTQLATIAPDQSRIVELRFFGGMTIDETAQALGISVDKVKRDWNMAKTWLHREIKND